MRLIELKNLSFENLSQDEFGYWIEFVRAKQRGRSVTTTILIPRRKSDWVPVAQDSYRASTDIDPASFIDRYLEALQADYGVPLAGLTGPFFRATHGQKGPRFIRTVIGKNMLSQVGIQLASELGLEHPECYTGHCWRRSCGTSASDAGVNVTTLMGLMGWSSPKTAMEYVSKSKHSCIKMSMYLTNVQRQNRPLILSESEFAKASKNGKLSSSSSLAVVSNLQPTSSSHRSSVCVVKPKAAFASSSSSSEVVCNIQSTSSTLRSSVPTVSSSVLAADDLESENMLIDSAALIREVEEEAEVIAASQALIDDLEGDDEDFNSSKKEDLVKKVVVVQESAVPCELGSSANSIRSSSIGDSLAGMFPHLSNSGTMNINIYFGK
jgi:hypothetical protein